MKQFLGLIALAAVVGVNASAATQTAVVEKIGTSTVVEAAALLNGGGKTASALVGQKLGGVIITEAMAPSVFNLANPIVVALSSKGIKATKQDFARFEALVSADTAGIVADAGTKAITAAIAKGDISDAAITAQVSAVKSENITNLLPSVINTMDTTEVLTGYVAKTEAGQAALNNTPATSAQENARAAALKSAIVDAYNACELPNASTCVALATAGYETWVANGYDQKGAEALSFIIDVHNGFPKEAGRAGTSQYLVGHVNAQQGIASDLAKGGITDLMEPLDTCYLGKK